MHDRTRPLSLWLVMALALFGLAWLIPNHYLPWPAFHGDVVAAAAASVLVGWALARQRPLTSALAVPLPAVLVFLVAAIPLLQAAFGLIHFRGDAWMACLYLFGFGLAIAAGGQGVSRRDLGIMAVITLSAALISVGVALIQWLELPRDAMYVADLRAGNRPYANLGQPNQFGTLLALGLVAMLALYESRRIGGLTAAVLAAVLFCGMSMSQSRTSWLQMGLLAAWLLWMRRRDEFRLTAPVIGLAVIGYVLLTLAWLPLNEQLLLSGPRSMGEQVQQGPRPIHWASLMEALMLRPLTGYGWNQVSAAQAMTAADHPWTGEVIEHAHNLVLDILVWNGLPLGLLLVSAIAVWVFRRTRACRDGLMTSLLAAIGVLLIHAMLELPHEYAYFLLPAGWIIGVIDSRYAPARRIVLPRIVPVLAAVVSVAMVGWTVHEYLPMEAGLRQLRMQSARIGAPGISQEGAPDALMLTQLSEFQRFARTEAHRQMSAEELDWMRKVAERFGYAPVVFRYALALGLNNRPAEAERALLRLCRTTVMDPGCEELQENWKSLADTKYPELAAVKLPEPDVAALKAMRRH